LLLVSFVSGRTESKSIAQQIVIFLKHNSHINSLYKSPIIILFWGEFSELFILHMRITIKKVHKSTIETDLEFVAKKKRNNKDSRK
jgi:hypothetical protein